MKPSIVSILAATLTAFSPNASVAADAPPRALRLTFPDLVQNRHALEVILFERAGRFHHGYALVPSRDNLPHRINVLPPPPIQWKLANGTPFEPDPAMMSAYAYKNKGFAGFRDQYASGAIKPEPISPTPPLSLRSNKLSGFVDVLLLMPETANQPGFNNNNQAIRIQIEGSLEGDAVSGAFSAWSYGKGDLLFGSKNAKTEGRFTGRFEDDYWKPRPGTELALGKDWPQATGPFLNMSAHPAGVPLVDSISDARLVWVAEDIMPCGRSGAASLRGGFTMGPQVWHSIGYGGFGAPAVAGGIVYQQVIYPDDKALTEPSILNGIYAQMGADPRSQAVTANLLRDAVFAFDARTGQRLWVWMSDERFGSVEDGKSGHGMTACIHAGKVYARGHTGLACLDAKTGKLLWFKKGDGDASYSSSNSSGGTTWSQDMSPVVIEGVLLLRTGRTLRALDPSTGNPKWKQENVIGQRAVPTAVTIEGKRLIAVASDAQAADARKKLPAVEAALHLIDPANGTILWRSTEIGSNPLHPAVWETLLIGNVAQGVSTEDEDKPSKKRSEAAPHAGGFQLGKSGAKRLWENSAVHIMPGRTTPAAARGIAYLDSRESGFTAIDMKSGKILGKHPHIYTISGGSHNWTWHAITDNRIISSHVLMFTTAEEGFRLLPGQLGLDLATGYMCPIQPAIADGRLFVRTGDKLVCYDLRKPSGAHSRTRVELTALDAVPGAFQPESRHIRFALEGTGSTIDRVASRVGHLEGPEKPEAAGWAGSWAGGTPWKVVSSAGDHKLGFDGGVATLRLRLGEQYEDWTFDLKREGVNLVGTYTRSIPPLDKPVAVKGSVEGQFIRNPDGSKRYNLYLTSAAAVPATLKQGRADVNLSGFVMVDSSGKITHAWAAAGKLNTVTHELDPTGLQLDGDKLQGELWVLFHDDEFFDLNPAASAETASSASFGTTLAARYRISASPTPDGKLMGSHEGEIGTAYTRSGKVGPASESAAP